MKLWLIAPIAAIAFAVTNPTQDEYASWLKQQAVSAQAAKNDGIEMALTTLFGEAAINAVTKRSDFLLFSIYSTDLGAGSKFDAIGILRHFVPISFLVLNGAPKSNFPHVVAVDREGNLLPEDGYTWVVNPPVPGDMRVRWVPSSRSAKNPHVISAATEGRWVPEDGYVWVVNPPVSGDLRVKWNPGRKSLDHPHVVAAEAEEGWKPEPGYSWFSNPSPPGDFRVKPIGAD